MQTEAWTGRGSQGPSRRPRGSGRDPSPPSGAAHRHPDGGRCGLQNQPSENTALLRATRLLQLPQGSDVENKAAASEEERRALVPFCRLSLPT